MEDTFSFYDRIIYRFTNGEKTHGSTIVMKSDTAVFAPSRTDNASLRERFQYFRQIRSGRSRGSGDLIDAMKGPLRYLTEILHGAKRVFALLR
jgi:hypothetical protein